MIVRMTLAAALACLSLATAPKAAWADCKLTSATIPITMAATTPLATAKVNGADLKFIIDSGAFYNTIDPKAAKARNMRPAPVVALGSRIGRSATTSLTGIGGDVEAQLLMADSFEFVGTPFKNVPFIATGDFGAAAGLIGQNLLRLSDVEYDFGKGEMRMTWPSDCLKADLAYWATGLPYSIIPLDRVDRNDAHTTASVEINGVRLRAMFDTGSDTTFITERAARRAGVGVSDPGVQAAGYSHGIGRLPVKTWTARFASIKIGEEEIKNGLLSIGRTDMPDVDILIGADFFLSHHIYVANSQGKLYFTYNGGQVFNHPPKDADPAPADPAKIAPNTPKG